ELHALTEEERDALEVQATLELHDKLIDIWDATDADWVKLQRFRDTVLVADRGLDADLPSIEDVWDSEVELDSGALIVGRPVVIEEMASPGPVVCTPRGHKDWRRYAYVRLIIGRYDREFHLDTGSPQSYISRD